MCWVPFVVCLLCRVVLWCIACSVLLCCCGLCVVWLCCGVFGVDCGVLWCDVLFVYVVVGLVWFVVVLCAVCLYVCDLL